MQFSILIVAISAVAVSFAVAVLYVATDLDAPAQPAPPPPTPMADLADLAARMSTLFYYALEDGEMRSHLPAKMQVAMTDAGSTPFRHLYSGCVEGLLCFGLTSSDPGWDHESYLRSKDLDVTDYCLRAHEVFTGKFEWMPRGTLWGEFITLCKERHSHFVLDLFAKLPEIITVDCRSRISDGWVVNRDLLFYKPLPVGMPDGHEDDDRRPMKFGRCAPATAWILFWEIFDPHGHELTREWSPVHQLPPDDTGEVAPGSAQWLRAADLPSIREAALEDEEIRSRLPADVQAAMGADPFTYQSYDCSGAACSPDGGLGHGWDHESYLRSRGLDTYDYCLAAHARFVEGIAWLSPWAYWDRFMYVCEHLHSDDTLEAFARLPGVISDECASRISEGWFLGKHWLLHYSAALPNTDHTEPAFNLDGRVLGFVEDCLAHGSEDTLAFFQPRPYTYEWIDKDINTREVRQRDYSGMIRYESDAKNTEASPPAELDPGTPRVDLAAELASLYALAIKDDDLRSLLPDDIQETIRVEIEPTGTYYPRGLASRLIHLHYAASHDDEMRSHLPEKIQRILMKGSPQYDVNDCLDPACRDMLRLDNVWDHESYLRSKSLDVTDYCLRAHEEFTESTEWVSRGALWREFEIMCASMHTQDVLRDFARLPEAISDGCKSRITEGWVVHRDGLLYRLPPGAPLGSGAGGSDHPVEFGECVPSKLGGWSAFSSRHGDAAMTEWRPAPPLPEGKAGGPAAEDLGQRKRDLAAELVWLYAMASKNDELHSLLRVIPGDELAVLEMAAEDYTSSPQPPPDGAQEGQSARDAA